jgi:hypothetical protein
LHLGVILSGATTFLSFFFAGPPVSFILAQCARDFLLKLFLAVLGVGCYQLGVARQGGPTEMPP